MNQQIASTASGTNGYSTPHDLVALTDEQILGIEPEAQDVEQSAPPQPTRTQESSQVAPASLPTTGSPSAPQNEQSRLEAGATQTPGPGRGAQPGLAVPQEPPEWLAQRMKDPWTGEEARELWNGVQQAKSETAAYRAAFATPEDARALKELYPAGVGEARAAAERARLLDDIDRSYFGGAGKSAQEISASRAQLAERMLQEDPAAFREMVFAGLRALEASGPQADSVTSVGARFSATSAATERAAQAGVASPQNQGGLKSAPANSFAQHATDPQGIG